jgi:acyl carrier protein
VGANFRPVSAAAATATNDDVLALLRATMSAEFGLAPDAIELSAHLIDDLDLDSIDLVDLAVSLEEERGIKLDEDDLKSVRTVGDAVSAVLAALARSSVRAR